MSSPRVWVYLAYKKTGRISEEKLIEKSANEHLTQTLSANGLIILEFCGSIEAVFSILSMLHMGRRQQWVNPLILRH